MEQPKVMYYRAREDLTVNDLPIFFGRVEFQEAKVRGKHYRARIDQVEKIYFIGYYWLEQEANQFLQKFQAHGDIEITEDEFDALLDRWTQHGQQAPFCWNPEEVQELE